MKRLSLVLFLLVLITVGYPLIKIASPSIKLAKITNQAIASTTTYAQTFFTASKRDQTAYVAQLLTNLEQLSENLTNFSNQTQQSWPLKKILSQQFSQLNTTKNTIALVQDLLTGTHTYLFLFQNSEEIRATGGFLGSYAKLKLNDGLLEDFKIQDIYVPSGQFTGTVEPPAGAKEYLSGNKGLKLQDANWHPDFPTSAQQILSFFALGNESDVDGVVAVNLPFIESILEITGPIYIPDSGQTITANNFSDIARVDRDQFFPGSQQKQHFLSTFFNQLTAKISQLNQSQQRDLIKTLMTNTQQKNLQFFSTQPKFQNFFEDQQLAGQLINYPQALSLMLVESNVGINKANQHLDRAVKIQVRQQKTEIEVSFTNHNQPPEKASFNHDKADHLAYINYQRLIIQPEINIEKIIFDGQEITKWDQEIITNSKGQEFNQIGFITTVPEKQTKKLSITLNHSGLYDPPAVWIQKQAGIPSTQYQVSYNQQSQSFSLTKDTLVELTP